MLDLDDDVLDTIGADPLRTADSDADVYPAIASRWKRIIDNGPPVEDAFSLRMRHKIPCWKQPRKQIRKYYPFCPLHKERERCGFTVQIGSSHYGFGHRTKHTFGRCQC